MTTTGKPLRKLDEVKIPWYEEYLWWPIERWWSNIKMFFKSFKWAYQRVKRGYSDQDLWSFDSYLADVLAGGLKQLGETTCSYPGRGVMNTPKKWENALALAAKRFQAVIDYEDAGWENDKDHKLVKKVYADQKKAIEFVAKWFNDLWD